MCSLLVAPHGSTQTLDWSVEVSKGYALPHRSEMLALVTGHSHGLAIRRGGWSRSGWRAPWSRHGPVWQGLELGWLYGGSEELGAFASALWFIKIPIRPAWHAELGTGIGWASSPYDPVDRPLSIAIGTPWNAGLHVGTSATVLSHERGFLAMGIGLTHFSNGALAMPNLGINNVHIRLRGGMNGQSRAVPQENNVTMPPPRWHCSFAVRTGMRDVNLPGGAKHPLVSSGLYVQREVNGFYGWTGAIDLTHNQSLRAYHLEPLTPREKLQLSSLVGINVHFGNAHLMLLQGWVWTRPDEALRRRHLQAVFAYDVHERWALEAGLRSFRLRADYPFIGLRFNP